MDNLPTVEDVNAVLAAPEELSVLSPEELAIGAKILPILAAKANATAEANKARELQKQLEVLRGENQKAMEAEMDKLRKAMAPPSAQDIEKLLSQEYLSFEVKIRDRSQSFQTFVIRELPLAAEAKFLRSLQRELVPKLKEVASIDWTGSTAEKIQRLIEFVPSTLGMLTEMCAVCLDPFEEEGVNKEWVERNMGLDRILSVLEAQAMAGRYRDFFLRLSALLPS
jgi:hypothetical protein